MENNTIVWCTEIHADIFSKDFFEQLHIEKIKLPPIDQSFYYDLGIWVNSINAYDTEKIRQYLFDRGSYRSLRNLDEEFDIILGEQFEPVYKAFKSLGYIFGSTFICAGGSGTPDSVRILLFRGQEKEYDKNGKLKKIITVHSHVPHGVGFSNLLRELVSTKKEILEVANTDKLFVPESDCPQEQNVPPLSSVSQITLQVLFKAVSTGVKANASICTNELIERCRILQRNPLLIESTNSKEVQVAPTIDMVAYPQWCLYTETKNHTWNISTFSSGAELQSKLLDICRQKSTYIAVPFHNLEPIDYTLSAKLFMGYTKITLAKASQYSDVQILWNNLMGP